ncbi:MULTISPECIES: DUF961 family protein [Enterococcus]|uniref:DUF961 domain-containing protein n=2 Tax=Enterococcus TaxID=1350 RepID=A0A6A8NLU9_ENTFC|nr:MULTISPECIES: DUF961 family protein [Enterococcus]EGO7558696.1 DUF961 domain-containing protein [Enterococcus faecalis]EGO7930660.1 DUF961 domain-containing protein [Enterococcus faecalis]EJC3740843.1 DUF961 family protein [Enterococcus faecium]EKG8971024.1 DUF961 family protein [Enterococcus faecalis]EKY8177425.1 DUF961 family protein [Enterococcus faecium]
MTLEFDQGIVPGLVKETLGEIYFVKAQRPRMLYEDNENTGEIKERPVEFSSATQQTMFVVNFPPKTNLDGLSFGDVVELEEVEFRFWISIDRESMSNRAENDLKVSALRYKKTGKNIFQMATSNHVLSAKEKTEPNKGNVKKE